MPASAERFVSIGRSRLDVWIRAPMDVTDDRDGSRYMDDVAFSHQQPEWRGKIDRCPKCCIRGQSGPSSIARSRKKRTDSLVFSHISLMRASPRSCFLTSVAMHLLLRAAKQPMASVPVRFVQGRPSCAIDDARIEIKVRARHCAASAVRQLSSTSTCDSRCSVSLSDSVLSLVLLSRTAMLAL